MRPRGQPGEVSQELEFSSFILKILFLVPLNRNSSRIILIDYYICLFSLRLSTKNIALDTAPDILIMRFIFVIIVGSRLS